MTWLVAAILVVLVAAFFPAFAGMLLVVIVAGALWEYYPTGFWVLGGIFAVCLIAGAIDGWVQGGKRPGLGSSYTTRGDRDSPSHTKEET